MDIAKEADPERGVPWQIWIVVLLLVLEGVGSVLSIPHQPAALYWVVAKCLFVTGLLAAGDGCSCFSLPSRVTTF